jgi:phage shock protein A
MKRSLTVVAVAIVAALANAGKTNLRAQDTPVDVMVKRSAGIAKANAQTLGANAMKFTSTLSTIGKAGAFAPKTYKVSPGEKGGLKIEPAPGQNDPTVHARPRADYAETVKQTSAYLGDHGYKDDIRELLAEVDRSENVMKGLKLRVVEKENFIDSLVQREDLLQSDVNKDKTALGNLHSHIKALRARIEKLKKTKQISELSAQYNEYKHAAEALKSQADQLASVKGALESKINNLKGQTAKLNVKEIENMRASISASANSTKTEEDGDSSGPAGKDEKEKDE